MPTRTYTITRALVLPLALNGLLLLAVFVLTFFRQGTAIERVLLMAAFIPIAVIAVESSLRKIEVSDTGFALSKFFKRRTFNWPDITHVGALAVRKKIYLVLSTTKGFYVLSNAYGQFGALVRDFMDHVEAERVEDGAKEILTASVENRSNIIAAWISAVILMAVAVMKMLA